MIYNGGGAPGVTYWNTNWELISPLGRAPSARGKVLAESASDRLRRKTRLGGMYRPPS